MSRPLRTVSAALAVGAVLLAGCSAPSGALPGDRLDRRRMYAVTEDEDASPAEVVEAGRAVDAARSGKHLLVAYTVHNDDDEGRSAAAWRLYDAEGRTVAEAHAGVTEEGSAHPDVVGLPDGFLVSDEGGPWFLLGTDGTRHRINRAAAPVVARTGDVPVGDGTARLYRPSTRTLFTAAPRLPRDAQGWAVADDGTGWLQGTAPRRGTARDRGVPFHRSTGGSAWERVASYDTGRKRSLASLALTAVGDRAVVPLLAEAGAPDRSRLVGLIVRSATAPADRPWRLLPAPPGAGTSWWDVGLATVDPTTVLVGTWGHPQFLVDVREGSWRRMEPPTGEDSWSYQTEDGRILATHFEHADAWFSDDRGRTWGRLPH